MNCNQARQIKIADFLNNMSISPERVYGDNAWYLSPLRNEKKPSFKVNLQKNRWFDLGTGEGGNILDLVMKMTGADLTGALSVLSSPGISDPSFFVSEKQKASSIEIKHLQPLQNRALIEYLAERKISIEIASRYVLEAYYFGYKDQVKPFFALAFKNDKDGYELRNGFETKNFPNGFKGCSNPKYITTIPGNENTINVFEGFMDFLSALTHFNTPKPGNKTIILNSTVNLRYIEQILSRANKVNAFLDNDETGKKAFDEIKAINPNTTNKAAIIYPGYNDFNDFICKTPTP